MELTARYVAVSDTGEHWTGGAPTEAWPRERQFVTWLIDNVGELGRVLGMRLEYVGREVPIGVQWRDGNSQREWWTGGRRLDIDLVDEHGRRVIVEAQLGSTDHSHLGQLVSYAHAADAQVVVWAIAGDGEDSPFYPDHLDALAELNEVYAGRRTFVVVEAVIESPRRTAPVLDDPLEPLLRKVDLTTMAYASDPGPLRPLSADHLGDEAGNVLSP